MQWRVHRFSADGQLINPGASRALTGQFNLPHSVWVHTDGRVFVCDRETIVYRFSAVR